MNDDDFLDRIEDDEEELYRSYIKPAHPVLSRIFVWVTLLAGIAVGVCLFLFFLTLFLYLFLPLVIIFSIWFFFRRWKTNREWRKLEKRFFEDS